MKQSQALEILMSGRNVFLTGEPGAGKSYVVRQFMECTASRVALTASTGIAGTNIGGQTIHAWSGIGARQELTGRDLGMIRNGPSGRRLRLADVLVIDEISMLSGDVLQMLDYVCRTARDARYEPFGGLQVILVGDFFQLPPVSFKRWRFAFEAPAWGGLDPAICYLTEQHRTGDPVLQELLTLLRRDECSRCHPALLSRHIRHNELPRDIPLLLTKNELVDRFNAAQLEELPGATCVFRMTSEGDPQHAAALMKGCQSPEVLDLKDGAVVIFTRNDPAGRFVNGSTGVVVEARGGGGWPRVRLNDKAKTIITAEPTEWQIDEPDEEEPIDTARSPASATDAAPSVQTAKRTLARIRQVPLRLAWGITVHKSQGMSLDAAAMDLSGAFEFGQGYVALSRVRSLAGLHLLGWNDRALRMHPAVLARDFEFRAASGALDDACNRDEIDRSCSAAFSAVV